MTATLLDGYRLLHEGALALAEVERNGIRIDLDYCRDKLAWTTEQRARSERRLRSSDLGRAWLSRFGSSTSFASGKQLQAVLYVDLGVKSFKKTASDQDSVDEESLRQTSVDGIPYLLRQRSLKKVSDVLGQFLQHQIDGRVYASYDLHTVTTYRSCVAKDTRILAARDFLSSPAGVPIQDVKVGDYVYCFDDALRPALRKVLWSGMTGHRRVVRLHWVERGGHGRGYLDVTPEHEVRLIDGSYVQAQYLDGADFRREDEKPYYPKVRTLSCSRVGDQLRFTGHLNNQNGILEHRFVYQNLVGSLNDDEVVPGNHTITKVEWLDDAADVYDIEVEGAHNFIANEICVHNSSSEPNLQNVPKRDKEQMDICRRALVPSPGNVLLEIDFSGIEVAVAACYHKDPNMLGYLRDPASDMHADAAKKLFFLDRYSLPELRLMENFKEVLRQAGKNSFIFPEFYGDYYESCAPNIACGWCKLPRIGDWTDGDGVLFDGRPIAEHLLRHDIRGLVDFTEHVRKVEDWLWNTRFPVYNQWRKDWYARYQRRGSFRMKTGFECGGVMAKNAAVNYPVQGPAFHLLLKTLTLVVGRIRGWLSKVVGEIHDSLLIDAYPAEVPAIVEMVRRIAAEELPKIWDWIIVPLRVEEAVSEVDGSWADMGDLKNRGYA